MIPEVLKKILPSHVAEATDRVNGDYLYEIRLRAERATSINFKGKYYYLSVGGLSSDGAKAIICTQQHIKDFLVRATDFSLYAVNHQICQGYLTISGGIRIGIAGETVFSEDTLKTIKNFNAVNIRVPHEVKNCANKLYPFIEGKGIYSTLILSPPGAGKTTILRDITRFIAASAKIYNVLLVDERDEIAAMNEGKNMLNIGVNCDVINGCTKQYAFWRAVRALRPDVIVTDELCGAEDALAVEYAISSGVAVIASVHAQNCTDLLRKPGYKNIVSKQLFNRYAVFSNRQGPGTLEEVLDENFNVLYARG